MNFNYSFYGFGDAMNPFFQSMLIGMIVFAVIIGLVFYIFQSLGLYTLAKRRGIHCYGLAWVPIGNLWVMGSLADQYDNLINQKNMYLRRILLAGGIAMYAFLAVYFFFLATLINSMSYSYVDPAIFTFIWIFMIFSLVIIAVAVFECIALYKVYVSANPQTATVFLVLSILFGLSPFFLFADRNKDLGMVAPTGPASQPQIVEPEQHE